MRRRAGHPEQCGSLAPLHGSSPGSILNAERPAPVSRAPCHRPHGARPGARRAGTGAARADPGGRRRRPLEHPHLASGPVAGDDRAARAEILMFNSRRHGRASGARRPLAPRPFPSGVHTMPIEATEHTGPIVIWRKELRPDSGGDGEFRGGLGQIIEIAAGRGPRVRLLGHVRPRQPSRQGPRRRHGAAPGVGRARRRHGDARQGWQHVPPGRRLILQLPGGGGYGDPGQRPRADASAICARDMSRRRSRRRLWANRGKT